MLSVEEIESSKYDEEDLKNEILLLQEQLNQFKPNMGAIREDREKQKVYEARQAELAEVSARCDEKKKEYEDLRQKR